MAWRRIAGALMAALLLGACLFVAGCNDYEPQSTEDEAARYYQEKYQSDAKVEESHGLGNYNLFGYTYSGMEYIMSDGVSVVYLDGDGMFYDNRQTDEIEPVACAFAEKKLAAIPAALTPVDVESVGQEPLYETYDGKGICWHTRYDGDIEAFLAQERPHLFLASHAGGASYSEGRFWYEMAYDTMYEAGLENAWLEIARYFSIDGIELAVVDTAAFEAAGEEGLSLFDDGLRYTVTFREENGQTVAKRFKPVFVKLFDGATISSMTAEVTLQEGDVSFEPLDEPGFYRCRVTGEAAQHEGGVEYFIRNDSANGITLVNGVDRLSEVCDPYEHRNYCKLYNDETYYLGDKSTITPWVEVLSVSADKVRVRYHTYFKSQIGTARLRVIGSAKRQNGTTWESTEFPSRIVGETDDGWLCEVDVVSGARPENTLHFQFSYDGDKDVTVQVEKDIQLA